jgi:hypothetical protein
MDMNIVEIQQLIDDAITTRIGTSKVARKLSKTDWLVARHRDQQALGIATSLSEAEYIELLEDRQEWRELVE